MRQTFSMAGAALLAVVLAGVATAASAQSAPPPGDASPAVAAEDWRQAAPDNLLVIDTTKGRILVEMTPEAAPGHVDRIRLLATASWPRRAIPWAPARARAGIPT
ncbi:MAG: hypothetical protein J0I52_02750 [Bordetella sp.]|nr:hypothetical protein [Bordetella sp.]